MSARFKFGRLLMLPVAIMLALGFATAVASPADAASIWNTSNSTNLRGEGWSTVTLGTTVVNRGGNSREIVQIRIKESGVNSFAYSSADLLVNGRVCRGWLSITKNRTNTTNSWCMVQRGQKVDLRFDVYTSMFKPFRTIHLIYTMS